MQPCDLLLIWSAIPKCFKNIIFDWLRVYMPKQHNVQQGTNLHLCISHFPLLTDFSSSRFETSQANIIYWFLSKALRKTRQDDKDIL